MLIILLQWIALFILELIWNLPDTLYSSQTPHGTFNNMKPGGSGDGVGGAF